MTKFTLALAALVGLASPNASHALQLTLSCQVTGVGAAAPDVSGLSAAPVFTVVDDPDDEWLGGLYSWNLERHMPGEVSPGVFYGILETPAQSYWIEINRETAAIRIMVSAADYSWQHEYLGQCSQTAYRPAPQEQAF